MMATVSAAYVLTVVAAIALAVRIVSLGSGHSIAPHETLGPVRVALIVIALLGAIAAAIAAVASESLAARATRIARARPAAPGEAEAAMACVDDFALALGFTSPTLRIVDDPTPNAFAAGRGRRCVVCVTTGALGLPPDQFKALCAQTMTSVANRALPLTCASADLMLIARRCTYSVWFVSALLLVSSIVGVPVLLTAAVTVAIIVVVVITIPLLALAQHAVPRLRARAAVLADLDAVSLTNQPAALARVLLAAARDNGSVICGWPIAPLWFDLDTRDAPPRRFARSMQLLIEPDVTETAPHRAARARRELIERARVLVALAGDDPKLHAELRRAEQS